LHLKRAMYILKAKFKTILSVHSYDLFGLINFYLCIKINKN